MVSILNFLILRHLSRSQFNTSTHALYWSRVYMTLPAVCSFDQTMMRVLGAVSSLNKQQDYHKSHWFVWWNQVTKDLPLNMLTL